MSQEKKNREYGIDLLRLVSMFMIVLLHVCGKGEIIGNTNGWSYAVTTMIMSVSMCGVNCFALISGHVGKNARYKFSNIIVLWLQIVLLSVLVAIVFLIAMPDMTGGRDVIRAFFPLCNDTYWYFTAYFGLFIIMPFLNAGINSIEKTQLIIIVPTIVVVFSFLSFVPVIRGEDFLFNLNRGFSFAWLVILYILGATVNLNRVKSIWLFAGFALCSFITGVSTIYSGFSFAGFSLAHDIDLLHYCSPTVLIASICLVELFSRAKLNEVAEKLVKFAAPLAFGVYIIHVNPLVWENIIAGRFAHYGSFTPVKLLGAIVITALGIFIICILLDFLRYKLFEALKIKKRLNELEFRLLKKLEITKE